MYIDRMNDVAMVPDDRLAYSAIVDRPLLHWPNDARVAVWVVPNIEHYQLMPRPNARRKAWTRTPPPDVLGYGLRDYGNRVGLWRMLDIIDRYDVPCTASLNVAAFEHYPEVMTACEERNMDYLCHGIYNTRYHWGLSEEDERAEITDAVDSLERLIGRAPSGWFGPAASQTLNTPDLVAESGFSYYSDWVHDEQPFPLRVRTGRLISVPYSTDLNDAVISRQGHDSEAFAHMVIDHFDALYEDGGRTGRVMCIAVHPYIMGQPHRIQHLDDALKHVTSRADVWMATGEQIANWYYQTMWDPMQAHLRASGGHDGR